MPRSRFHKFAVWTMSLLAAAALPGPPALAGDAAEWGAFGIQTQWIDRNVRPGDDFDRYVNGLWIDATEIPEDKARIGAFMTLRDLSEDRLKEILEELAGGSHPAGSDEARLAAAYSAFMDTAAIETAGLAPARPVLDRIFAAASIEDLARLFATPGVASPIGLGVEPDQKATDRYALYVGQAGLGLPERDYYLSSDAKVREIQAKYRDYLALLLAKAGYEDPRSAANAVYSLELRLAQETWDRAVRRDRDLTYNKLGEAELRALDGGGWLRTFLDEAGANAAKEAIVIQMPPTGEELAAARIGPAEAAARLGGGVPATLALVAQVPLSTWKAYLAAHFLSDHAAYLPAEIDDAHFAFYGTVLGGQPKQRPRWKRGISAVESQVGELLGKIYAQRYYPPEVKAQMDQLVANLREAMAANLRELDWMGRKTRAEAERKLAAFTPKIGAPEAYKTYDGLVLSGKSALGNALASERWQHDFAAARLGKPVDRGEWFMFPQTVNAYYNGDFNEIVFPAAILQPPFFNPFADPAVNYGAIGAVIGHEMGHGFDDQGSKSDGQGNLRDWWTPADKANFHALQEKLVAQFNRYCPFDQGRTCVNGRLTLGENIGDLGGLSLAYRAYRLSLGGREAAVIDGFTGDQRFFMGWAQVWKGKTREALARQYLVTDPHSPPAYRINGIVRNFDEWHRAFGVGPKDKLYLPPERRVRIW